MIFLLHLLWLTPSVTLFHALGQGRNWSDKWTHTPVLRIWEVSPPWTLYILSGQIHHNGGISKMKAEDREGIPSLTHGQQPTYEVNCENMQCHIGKTNPKLFCLWTTLNRSSANLGMLQPRADSKSVACILLFVLCFVLCCENSTPVKAARYDGVQHN